MELKISNITAGLNPEKYLDNPTTFAISKDKDAADTVVENDRKSKQDKEYTDYTLFLVGATEEYVGEYSIKFLFDRDLKELFDEFGSNTLLWEGKRITLSAVKEGKYNRWVLKPFVALNEETVDLEKTAVQ